MTTESEALMNILAWSADCPAWQRDALRRLATKPTLENNETDELIAICKGLAQAVPFDASHIRTPNLNHGEVKWSNKAGHL
ncbi:MAG: hypothetical protein PHR16_17900 [Methylovulum sp.]|nr:hypothetical protein [Methylovulum sp.]